MRAPSLRRVRPGSIRTAATIAAVTATGLTLSMLGAAPASAANTGNRADRAANWEVTQLDDGRIDNVAFDFTDWGLTLDTYFGLVAAGNRDKAARTVIRTASANVRTYVSFDGDFYAGALAKSLLARRVAGLPADVEQANLDLRRRLLSLVADSGRVMDSGRTDFSNTITQSLSVLALSRSGRARTATVRFLLRQQCDAGYFSLSMTGPGCDRDGGSSDVDATAYALQALRSARNDDAGSVPLAAIQDTGAWLAGTQKRNGAFSGAGPTNGANTNSTGLAAQALTSVNRDRAARAGAEWIVRQQLTRSDTAGSPARRDVGAIAYNRADYKLALSEGITKNRRDVWRRSTPQAISGLAPEPLSSLSAP